MPFNLIVERLFCAFKHFFFNFSLFFSSLLIIPLTSGRKFFCSEMKRKSGFSFAFRSLICTFAA